MAQKFYLTKEGLAKIEKEYQDLKNLRMAKVRGESPKILHSEDLNPEYLLFQEDLNFLEARIAELEYILKNAELIKPPTKAMKNLINLGARVLVEVDGQSRECLVYVDPVEKEGRPKQEYIDRINKGISDSKLPSEYINRYLRKFIPA